MTNNPYSSPTVAEPQQQRRPPTRGSRVIVALVCLHISAVIYFLLGLALPALMLAFLDQMQQDEKASVTVMSFFAFAICVGLAIGVEVVASGVRKRSQWAWIVGLIVFGLYLPSAFFPLGALGLWGLLAEGSRAEFDANRGL